MVRPAGLLRVERPSDLGAWSYEAVDTKLAAETRGGTILQLCLYSDLLARVQGCTPESMFVVAPGRCARPERFRVDDYLAYYRRVRSALERAVESPRETYPEPVPHCEVCRWWPECDRRRRADDHLSLVAGATRLQRRELAARGLETVEKLARTRLPFDPRPARGSLEAFPRTYDQARVQLASRGARTPAFESIEPTLGRCGLGRLPAPSPGDVFFDLEGDPFVADGGREYLFGWAVRDEAGRP